MARILRAKNFLSPRTPRDVSGTAGTDKWSGSKHDPAELTRRTTSKRSVRRLMVNDPMNDPLTRNLDEFTNNPNPKFDPSRAPGGVRKATSVVRMAVGKASRGHSKVFKPNNFTRTGGKTLKRR